MLSEDCGPNFTRDSGQATLGLLPFEEIIAVDPSKTMTEAARMYIDQELEREGKSKMKDKFKFRNASAEELPFLDNASVDFVMAGTLFHSASVKYY